MNKIPRFFALAVSLSSAALAWTQPSDPALERLFPIPEEAQRVIEQRCVFCHGEVIDGEAEIREDLDLSSEEAIRATLFDVATLIEMIEEDEMPQEAKLSFRLRRQPEMRERLSQLQAAYEENGEKEILLAWLRGAAR